MSFFIRDEGVYPQFLSLRPFGLHDFLSFGEKFHQNELQSCKGNQAEAMKSTSRKVIGFPQEIHTFLGSFHMDASGFSLSMTRDIWRLKNRQVSHVHRSKTQGEMCRHPLKKGHLITGRYTDK